MMRTNWGRRGALVPTKALDGFHHNRREAFKEITAAPTHP